MANKKLTTRPLMEVTDKRAKFFLQQGLSLMDLSRITGLDYRVIKNGKTDASRSRGGEIILEALYLAAQELNKDELEFLVIEVRQSDNPAVTLALAFVYRARALNAI